MTPVLTLVARHVRLVALVALATSVVAFGLSYLWTPRYTATTHVLIRAQDSRILNQNGQNLAQQAIIDQSLAKTLGDTDSSLVTSRTVAVAVVDDLKLDRRPEDQSPVARARRALHVAKDATINILVHGYYATPSPREAAITQVQNNVVATPVKDGFIIEIKASAENPNDAAQIANAASAELIKLSRARDEQEANRYRDFLKQQLDDYGAQVTAAEAAVAKYKRDNGISDVNEELRLSAQSSSDVTTQLRDTDVQLAASKAQLASLQAEMYDTPSQTQTTNTIATGRSTTTTTQTNSNTVYNDLRVNAAQVDAQVASLQARHDALTNLLTAQTTALPDQQAQLQSLELKLQTANAAYSGVSQEYNNASSNSAFGVTELTAVDTAAAPLYPDRPLRYLFLVVGLVIGVFTGTGLAWWVERRMAVRPWAYLFSPGRIPSIAPESSPAG